MVFDLWELTILRVPHPSIGILNKAYSEVALSGVQVELPGVKSMAGDRGGSVREAGTEKTKWRSIVHTGGRHIHTNTHIELCEGQLK